jgi:transcriptional regulator with XRE-family HTH domain
MASLKELVEPKSQEEAEEFALEDLVLSIQLTLQKSMEEQKISKTELARRIGVSKSRVSQILGDGSKNVNLKTVARIAVALREEFEFVPRRDSERYQSMGQAGLREMDRALSSLQNSRWRDASANENRVPVGVAA